MQLIRIVRRTASARTVTTMPMRMDTLTDRHITMGTTTTIPTASAAIITTTTTAAPG